MTSFFGLYYPVSQPLMDKIFLCSWNAPDAKNIPRSRSRSIENVLHCSDLELIHLAWKSFHMNLVKSSTTISPAFLLNTALLHPSLVALQNIFDSANKQTT